MRRTTGKNNLPSPCIWLFFWSLPALFPAVCHTGLILAIFTIATGNFVLLDCQVKNAWPVYRPGNIDKMVIWTKWKGGYDDKDYHHSTSYSMGDRLFWWGHHIRFPDYRQLDSYPHRYCRHPPNLEPAWYRMNLSLFSRQTGSEVSFASFIEPNRNTVGYCGLS